MTKNGWGNRVMGRENNFLLIPLQSSHPETGKKLEELDLSRSPVSISPEILVRNVEEILDSYFRVKYPNETESPLRS
ncbi:MAG: hypothetical protein AAF915_16365 [Cyanobacteria bacterium P01_D01_bin.50]